MALVVDGWVMTMDVVDTSGSVSQLRYDLTAATYADATTEAATIPPLFDAVSNATVRGYTVSEKYLENAFTIPANAENAIKAEITGFIQGEGTKKALFRIPAPAAAIFTNGTGAGFNIVDLGNAAVLAYAGIFESGGIATISDGESLVVPVSNALNSGRRISVKSRNP